MRREILAGVLGIAATISCGGRPPGVVKGVESSPTSTGSPTFTVPIKDGTTKLEPCEVQDSEGNVMQGYEVMVRFNGKWIENPGTEGVCFISPTPQPTR